MGSNPFLDPDREIQQGRSEEDILAAWEERQRRFVERVASLGPGEAYSGTIEELAGHLYAGLDTPTEIFSIQLADIKSHYVGETAKMLQRIYSQITESHAQGSTILIEIDELLLPDSIREGMGSRGGLESEVDKVIYNEVINAFMKLGEMPGVTAVSAHTAQGGREYRIIFRNDPDGTKRRL